MGAASREELTALVGAVRAERIYDFFPYATVAAVRLFGAEDCRYVRWGFVARFRAYGLLLCSLAFCGAFSACPGVDGLLLIR